ncbi:MAG TPA: ribosomal protein S18-alanine N-acetyltransferase [Terriglobales bacterium]|nr:ribosomal protein S18-alanine N-acetyltransferase [Terriglobales bacterium]
MRIRAATSADISSILQIERNSGSAAHWPESVYDAVLRDMGRVVFVAEDDDRAHGFLVASCRVEEWELENIVVCPGLRRQGIGRLLMSSLIKQAVEKGAEEIRQEIRASNKPALKLARSAGFAVAGIRRGYYADPQEDAVLLTLKTRSVPFPVGNG